MAIGLLTGLESLTTMALQDPKMKNTGMWFTLRLNVSDELKKRAADVRPIGFVYEGMVESTRDEKHAPPAGD